MKVEKSLLETWEWEEKIYNKIKDLPWDEAVKKIDKDGKLFLGKWGISLKKLIIKK